MKKTLILKTLLVLFLGIVIGILAGGRFTMHKIHKAKDMRTEHGFVKHVSDSFNLEHESKDTVKIILKNFARIHDQKHRSLQEEIHKLHTKLENDLSIYLSESEMRKFRRIMRHNKPRPPRGRKRINH